MSAMYRSQPPLSANTTSVPQPSWQSNTQIIQPGINEKQLVLYSPHSGAIPPIATHFVPPIITISAPDIFMFDKPIQLENYEVQFLNNPAIIETVFHFLTHYKNPIAIMNKYYWSHSIILEMVRIILPELSASQIFEIGQLQNLLPIEVKNYNGNIKQGRYIIRCTINNIRVFLITKLNEFIVRRNNNNSSTNVNNINLVQSTNIQPSSTSPSISNYNLHINTNISQAETHRDVSVVNSRQPPPIHFTLTAMEVGFYSQPITLEHFEVELINSPAIIITVLNAITRYHNPITYMQSELDWSPNLIRALMEVILPKLTIKQLLDISYIHNLPLLTNGGYCTQEDLQYIKRAMISNIRWFLAVKWVQLLANYNIKAQPDSIVQCRIDSRTVSPSPAIHHATTHSTTTIASSTTATVFPHSTIAAPISTTVTSVKNGSTHPTIITTTAPTTLPTSIINSHIQVDTRNLQVDTSSQQVVTSYCKAAATNVSHHRGCRGTRSNHTKLKLKNIHSMKLRSSFNVASTSSGGATTDSDSDSNQNNLDNNNNDMQLDKSILTIQEVQQNVDINSVLVLSQREYNEYERQVSNHSNYIPTLKSTRKTILKSIQDLNLKRINDEDNQLDKLGSTSDSSDSDSNSKTKVDIDSVQLRGIEFDEYKTIDKVHVIDEDGNSYYISKYGENYDYNSRDPSPSAFYENENNIKDHAQSNLELNGYNDMDPHYDPGPISDQDNTNEDSDPHENSKSELHSVNSNYSESEYSTD
jgi:hypothetical protein